MSYRAEFNEIDAAWNGERTRFTNEPQTGFTRKDKMFGPPGGSEQSKIRKNRRPDFGHLEIRVTVDDPKAYTKPWSVPVAHEVTLQTMPIAHWPSGASRAREWVRVARASLGSDVPTMAEDEVLSPDALRLRRERTPGLTTRALHEDATWRPHIHRIKVVSILNVRGVGVAQLLVNRFLLCEFLLAVHCQGDVMYCARAESPVSGGTIGLVLEDQGFSRTAGTDLETVILAFLTGLTETKCVDEEPLTLGNFAHTKHCGVKAAYAFAGSNLIRSPTLTIIVRLFENFKR